MKSPADGKDPHCFSAGRSNRLDPAAPSESLVSATSRMVGCLLVIGVVSILGQVVILRELSVAFYGVELIYILAIGIWLLWTACGALIGRRAYDPSSVDVEYILLALGLLLLPDVLFIRGIRVFFSAVPGAYLPFEKQIATVFISLMPVGLLLGLSFQWAAKRYVSIGRTLAKAYAIESLGGLIGGLLATLLLSQGIQNVAIAIVCCLLCVSLPMFQTGMETRRCRYGAVAAAGVLCVCLGLSGHLDRRMTALNHPDLVVSKDSPYSRITVTGREGQFVVYENDALGFETQSTASEEFVHLAAVHQETLDRVLISGGGVEGIVGQILKHHPRKVDYVELNGVLLDLVKDHLPQAYYAALTSDIVSIRVADPRQFLSNAGPWDLILTAMPEPFSGQSNRFYTREYFQLCADRLTPQGVFAFRLPSSENVWTKTLSFRNASIVGALASVFRDVLVLPGLTNTIIASNKRLSRDPNRLIGRLTSRNIQTSLMTSAYMTYLYTNDRFYEVRERLASTRAPENTDDRPICYQYSSIIWISKFIRRMMHWDLSFLQAVDRWRGLFFLWAAFLLCMLPVAFGRRRRLRRMMLAAVAGFMGMMLETILILYYQAKNGVLFQNIGLLLMVFMAGLAAGSMSMTGTIQRCRKTAGTVSKRIGAGLVGGFAVLNLLFVFSLRRGVTFGILLIGGFLFAAGFLVAGVFAYASLAGVYDQKKVVAPLYAADLLGGCAASLFGSLLLIPFFGFIPSAVWMAGLSLVALLLIRLD